MRGSRSWRSGLLHRQPGRMHQRGDRRQRVVELVADHPDHLLPHPRFLAVELAGEPPQQHQLVAPLVEGEEALGDVEGLGFAAALDREKAVAAVGQGLGHLRRAAADDLGEGPAGQPPAAEQDLRRPRGWRRSPGRR